MSTSTVLLALAVTGGLHACDLCAIYRAADAKGDYGSGWMATAAVQYVPWRTVQFNGTEFAQRDPDFLERWMVHGVVGWNLGENFGLSVNVPEVVQSYQRFELQDGVRPHTIRGNQTGLGDVSVVGRWRAWSHSDMNWGLSFNVLGGLKLPTGSVEFLEDQERQVRAYEALVGPGHTHDALGQVGSGVHPADLSLGSGSVDGILGLTTNARWRRAFLNAQFQYYVRTEGAGSYRYADDLMASGGPGFFLYVKTRTTLSLQGNVAYETEGSDELFGRTSAHSGMTAWYAGPVLVFTWKSRFSALASADVPVRIANRGFQNVPDYRLNFSVTYRF